MNTIRIDTSDNLNTRVILIKNGGEHIIEEHRKTPGDQNVLELLERLLKTNKTPLKEIDCVEVHTGPGSFTGLKVGAAIANALAFGIHVTVNKNPIGEVVEPTY